METWCKDFMGKLDDDLFFNYAVSLKVNRITRKLCPTAGDYIDVKNTFNTLLH